MPGEWTVNSERLARAGRRDSTSTPGLPRIEYVYILGASHSGSTLLAMLLNAHPDVVSVGELSSGGTRDLRTYRCSCRRLMCECPFWCRVSEQMRQSDPDFSLADFGERLDKMKSRWVRRLVRLEHRGRLAEAMRDLLLGASFEWRRHFEEASRHLYALARIVLAANGARIIVDSSKRADRLKFVRRMPGLSIKVIHMVRDGRAVALTYMDPDRFADAEDPAMRRGGSGASNGGSPHGLTMARAADEWRRDYEAALFALGDLDGSSWKQVRYEDMCRAPEAVLRELFAFLGVNPNRMVRDFRAVDHHVVGNGMRLDSRGEIKLDERWRTVLTSEELGVFEAVAGRLSRRFGYR